MVRKKMQDSNASSASSLRQNLHSEQLSSLSVDPTMEEEAPFPRLAIMAAFLLLLINFLAISAAWGAPDWLDQVAPGRALMLRNFSATMLASGIVLILGMSASWYFFLLKQWLAAFVVVAGFLAFIKNTMEGRIEGPVLLVMDMLGGGVTHPLGASPFMAIGIVILGLSLFLYKINSHMSQLCGLFAIALIKLMLLGFFWGIEEFQWAGDALYVVLHVTVSFTLLVVGLITAQSNSGVLKILASDVKNASAGRLVFISASLMSFLSILCAGFLSLYNSQVELALLAILSMTLIEGGVAFLVNKLNGASLSIERVSTELDEVHLTIERRVVERTRSLREKNLQLSTELAERKRTAEHMRHLSLTDDLTGLQNRRSFFLSADQALKAEKAAGRSCLLLFIDLDGLKAVNDTQGHEAGDRLILAAAQVLLVAFREHDLVARIGGDEFAVLVRDDNARSCAIESRLRALTEDANRAGRSSKLSMSVGCVCCDPDDSISLDGLLVKADQAMYKIKQAKRDLGWYASCVGP